MQLAEKFAAMMHHQEEPVQSSSVFTQYMVYSTAAEEATTVLLDGQGADEILGGYPRYSHWYLQMLLRNSVRLCSPKKNYFYKMVCSGNGAGPIMLQPTCPAYGQNATAKSMEANVAGTDATRLSARQF